MRRLKVLLIRQSQSVSNVLVAAGGERLGVEVRRSCAETATIGTFSSSGWLRMRGLRLGRRAEASSNPSKSSPVVHGERFHSFLTVDGLDYLIPAHLQQPSHHEAVVLKIFNHQHPPRGSRFALTHRLSPLINMLIMTEILRTRVTVMYD